MQRIGSNHGTNRNRSSTSRRRFSDNSQFLCYLIRLSGPTANYAMLLLCFAGSFQFREAARSDPWYCYRPVFLLYLHRVAQTSLPFLDNLMHLKCLKYFLTTLLRNLLTTQINIGTTNRSVATIYIDTSTLVFSPSRL